MLVALLALLALAPASAAASSGSPWPALARAGADPLSDNGFVATFEIGSGGRRIQAIAFRRHIYAVAFNPRLFSTTSYLTGARVSASAVKAGFGSLGRISVEFVPKGEPEQVGPPRGCQGKPQEVRDGSFVGSIVFSGSPGFPHYVDRSFKAEGTMTKWPRWHCRGERETSQPPSEEGDGVRLTASACGRSFSALGERPVFDVFPHGRDPVSYLASASEERGRVLIDHSLTVSAKPRTFVFDEPLTTAGVTPPPPFHGTASLQRDASGSVTWSGSLSVDIGGRRVRLAGPGFVAGLASFPIEEGIAIQVSTVTSCRRAAHPTRAR